MCLEHSGPTVGARYLLHGDVVTVNAVALNIGYVKTSRGDYTLAYFLHNAKPLSGTATGRISASQPDIQELPAQLLLAVWRERFSPAPMTGAPKPPMGVKPRKVHDEERSNALDEAIDRYLREDLPIPLEWVVEYNELRERLNKQGV